MAGLSNALIKKLKKKYKTRRGFAVEDTPGNIRKQMKTGTAVSKYADGGIISKKKTLKKKAGKKSKGK